MSAEESMRAIEAIVLVSPEPVEAQLLAQLLELPTKEVELLCGHLAASYDAAGHGFQLVKVAGGWRFQSHPDLAPYVERFVLEGQPGRLSAAALETLAIVAYKQPLSRAQIAAIRGVDPDGVLRTLAQRGYVEQVGKDPGPGQAALWGTTREFLERLGLASLDQLPPLADFIPGADVVEALEHGLRVPPAMSEARAAAEPPVAAPAPAPPPLANLAGSSPEVPPALEPEVIVDLRDGAPTVDLTQQPEELPRLDDPS